MDALIKNTVTGFVVLLMLMPCLVQGSEPTQTNEVTSRSDIEAAVSARLAKIELATEKSIQRSDEERRFTMGGLAAFAALLFGLLRHELSKIDRKLSGLEDSKATEKSLMYSYKALKEQIENNSNDLKDKVERISATGQSNAHHSELVAASVKRVEEVSNLQFSAVSERDERLRSSIDSMRADIGENRSCIEANRLEIRGLKESLGMLKEGQLELKGLMVQRGKNS